MKKFALLPIVMCVSLAVCCGQKPSETESPPLKVEEARQAIAAEQRQRQLACERDIKAALAKHSCSLIPVVAIIGRDVSSEVRIVPN